MFKTFVKIAWPLAVVLALGACTIDGKANGEGLLGTAPKAVDAPKHLAGLQVWDNRSYYEMASGYTCTNSSGQKVPATYKSRYVFREDKTIQRFGDPCHDVPIEVGDLSQSLMSYDGNAFGTEVLTQTASLPKQASELLPYIETWCTFADLNTGNDLFSGYQVDYRITKYPDESRSVRMVTLFEGKELPSNDPVPVSRNFSLPYLIYTNLFLAPHQSRNTIEINLDKSAKVFARHHARTWETLPTGEQVEEYPMLCYAP